MCTIMRLYRSPGFNWASGLKNMTRTQAASQLSCVFPERVLCTKFGVWQVMVWNWLEYRMNLQHIGAAWGRPHEKPSKTCCDKGLLWNTFVHVVMYAYYGLKVSVCCFESTDPLVHGAGCCPVEIPKHPVAQVLKIPTT